MIVILVIFGMFCGCGGVTCCGSCEVFLVIIVVGGGGEGEREGVVVFFTPFDSLSNSFLTHS